MPGTFHAGTGTVLAGESQQLRYFRFPLITLKFAELTKSQNLSEDIRIHLSAISTSNLKQSSEHVDDSDVCQGT